MTTLKRQGWMAALVALIVLTIWSGAAARRAEGPLGAASAPAYTSYASGDFFFPPYPSDSDRMGVSGSIDRYNPVLKAGWYMDWGANANPPHPGGMEYARLIYFQVNTPNPSDPLCTSKVPASQRSEVTESITGTALIENLRANPGALWLIGNEPDSIYNCSPIMPELYAELYHEFYTFIKTYDPSAQVAIGAIVQPSPLRLEYMDKVLNRYQTLYGVKLPTALWNIHLYAFPERAGSAGAGVPPGASSTVGWTYNWRDTVDINILAQNLRAMRQWMADRGERNKPLIITEFGQVVPDDGSYTLDGLTFTEQTSRDYLQGSITHFLTATDPQIGYPADGNRLMQFWAWYSLYDPFYGGDLVYLDRTLTPAGTAFAQIGSQRFVPYADLYPVSLGSPSVVCNRGARLSWGAQVNNHGNSQIQGVPVRFEQYDAASGNLLASSLVTVSQVLTRYAGTQPQVSAEWPLWPATSYTLTLQVDPAHTISQARRTSQTITDSISVELSDLDLTLATNSPTDLLWTEPVTPTITATLRNVGNLTSAASVVRLITPDTGGTAYLTLDTPAPALAPNASFDVTGTFVIPSPGQYVITATLSQYEASDKCVENNTVTLSILAARYHVNLPLVLR